MTDQRPKRGPGRPPDLAKRRAIIDATLELLAEVGYGSMTIDAVAQRAQDGVPGDALATVTRI